MLILLPLAVSLRTTATWGVSRLGGREHTNYVVLAPRSASAEASGEPLKLH